MSVVVDVVAIVLGLHVLGFLILMGVWAVFTEINRQKFLNTLTLEERDLIRRYHNLPFWKVQK